MKNGCRLLSRWLIMSLLCVLIVSCGVPRSVRNSDKTKKIAKKMDSKNDNQNTLTDIQEFEKKVLASKSNNDSKPEQESSLPSLKSQLQNLSMEQVEIKNKVNTLQNDVIEIKYTLEEIKSALIKDNKMIRKQAVSGPEEELNQSDESNTSDEEFVVMPEEKSKELAIKKKESPKKPAAKKTAPKPIAKWKESEAKPNYKIAPASTIVKTEPKSEPIKQENIKPEMSEALNLFAKKDFNNTILKMNEILNSTKDKIVIIDCHFWIGESYFNLKDFRKAIDYFAKVIKAGSSDKRDDAQSKMAECFVKTGNISEAKTAYQTLIEKYPGSEYIPKAKKMLQQL